VTSMNTEMGVDAHGMLRPLWAAMGCAFGILAAQCSSVCEPGTSCDYDVSPRALGAGASSETGESSQTAGDDVNTPGDERAGFVACSGDASAEAASCTGEGLGCCAAPTPTCTTYEACLAANNGNPMLATYHECDGPEDCEAGERCLLERGGTMCAPSGGHVSMCHVDSDCPVEGAECRSGECSVAAVADAMPQAGGV